MMIFRFINHPLYKIKPIEYGEFFIAGWCGNAAGCFAK
jgi:hypothetical protein